MAIPFCATRRRIESTFIWRCHRNTITSKSIIPNGKTLCELARINKLTVISRAEDEIKRNEEREEEQKKLRRYCECAPSRQAIG